MNYGCLRASSLGRHLNFCPWTEIADRLGMRSERWVAASGVSSVFAVVALLLAARGAGAVDRSAFLDECEDRLAGEVADAQETPAGFCRNSLAWLPSPRGGVGLAHA
jgi:hypothetical protein